ncbi:hypothetical protein [uncultured Sphingomonas sp.]|uniref:hypothetical protein n=1 Tax=uncultured Sphingomonas sp. TaxID=158754 RepID=UPI0035C9F6C7
MPNAARHHEPESTPAIAPAAPVWADDALGPVGAMHRAIEERMLGGAEMVAVLSLRPRPAEAFARLASRIAGWASVAACGATALVLLTR